MHGKFSGGFLIILSLFANLKLIIAFYSWKFLVYKMETSRNCQEVKHMIMIIAIIYIFLPDMIFDQQLKITLGKSSAPLKKPTPPYLLTSLKIQKF